MLSEAGIRTTLLKVGVLTKPVEYSDEILPAYYCTEVHSHSTVHWPGRFYCLIPVVSSLHHRCRSLQSSGSYWRECVDHLWEYQDHHSQWLE